MPVRPRSGRSSLPTKNFGERPAVHGCSCSLRDTTQLRLRKIDILTAQEDGARRTEK
jgi:hypothetical protein